jgi:hypothetical protein
MSRAMSPYTSYGSIRVRLRSYLHVLRRAQHRAGLGVDTLHARQPGKHHTFRLHGTYRDIASNGGCSTAEAAHDGGKYGCNAVHAHPTTDTHTLA